MKQETKELIKWIKDRLERTKWENSFAKNEGKDIPDFDEDYDKAITFLDSLEEVEEQLKHGGFIPDMNNTPCKDGDYVSFYYKKSGYVETFTGIGTLTWDSTKSMFTVIGDDESPSFDGVYSKDIKLLKGK